MAPTAAHAQIPACPPRRAAPRRATAARPARSYVSPKGDGTHGAGNSCGTSQPAPEGPYMQLCSGCEMSNQWLLTCKSCNNNTDVVPLSMCTASANGCGAFNNVGVCNLQNGSAALNCGAACPARR